MLAAQTAADLPHLRELFLVKGYAVDPGHRGQFGHPGALGRPERQAPLNACCTASGSCRACTRSRWLPSMTASA